MASNRVNCYLPDELADAYRARFGGRRSFSEVLRRGVIAELREAEQLEGAGEQLEEGAGA